MAPVLLFGVLIAAASQPGVSTQEPSGRNVVGVYVSQDPDRVAVVPEKDPPRAWYDTQDSRVVEEVLRNLLAPDADPPPNLARMPVIEVRRFSNHPEPYHLAPISFSELRRRLRGCVINAESLARHLHLPGRSFFVFGWKCPGDSPREQQVTMLAIKNHRPLDIYYHSDGAVSVWSTRPRGRVEGPISAGFSGDAGKVRR